MKFLRFAIIGIVFIALIKWLVSGALVNSLTGKDIKNWGHITKEQRMAYKIKVDHLRKKNLKCGTVSYQSILAKWEKGQDLNPAEEVCLEQIIKGPASPRDDIPDMIQGIKNAFAGEPEPKPRYVRTISYEPRVSGVGGLNIPIPNDGKVYEIKYVSGHWEQVFDDRPFPLKFSNCNGNRNIVPSNIDRRKMPNPNSSYGECRLTDYGMGKNINLNIPQTTQEYADITGLLELELWVN